MLSFIHAKKNLLLALACVLLAAICVGAAVLYSSGRSYETVQGASKPQDAQTDHAASASAGGPRVVSDTYEQEGISVSLQGEIPESLDPSRFIKQAFELKHFLAVDSFVSAEEIPVGPAVQYAFCYLYAGDGCLLDYKPSAMTYRQASENEIREQIVLLFGACPFDIRESDLFAAGKGYFEMWQPDYSGTVYAEATLAAASGGGYELKASYFEDAAKTIAAGTAVMTIGQGDDGRFYLAALS